MHSDEEAQRMREFAAKLDFDIDEDVAREALDAAEPLRESVDTLRDDYDLETDSIGEFADDEYGALLDVYPEPRTEGQGPLDGISLAIKDVVAAKNLRMTLGLEDYSYVPSFDSSVVDRLLKAGGTLVGKANTDALAIGPSGEFSEIKEVINPAAEDRVPGGSSSGPAAAVAGGLVDASIGTDTGGSIRIPAACCGVVGMRPTHGLVPRYGLYELAPSADTIGPLARDVETAAKVLEAIVGHDPKDPTSSYARLGPLADRLDARDSFDIGLPTSFFDNTADEVSDVVRGLAARLADVDSVEIHELDLEMGEITNAHPLLSSPEFSWLQRQSLTVRGQGTQYNPEFRAALQEISYNDHIALRKLPSAYIDDRSDGESYLLGRREEIRFKEHLLERFETVDLLLTPTLRAVPPKRGLTGATHEGIIRMTGNTGPISRVGFPVISVPAGEHDGIPVGAQLIAPGREDLTVLQGAKLVEDITNTT